MRASVTRAGRPHDAVRGSLGVVRHGGGTDGALRRGGGDRGFTLVETLVATMVLAVGMLATAVVYDGSRGLTAVSERTSVMAHRAQAEIERVEALGYAHVALTGAPVPSSDLADSASMLVAGSPFRLCPDRRVPTGAGEELAIDATDGAVAPTPRSWSDGRLRGRLHTWVSWWTDPRCGAGCPASRNGKRVTVVVTDEGAGHDRGPLVTSVVLTDPNAAPAGAMQNGARNPLSDPTTVCVSSGGTDVPCSRSIGTGSATSWFLYDTSAKNDVRVPVGADHAVHPTVLGSGPCTLLALLGCPVPDLMGDEPPPSGPTLPPLLDRSVGISGSEGSGGRVLRTSDAGCAGSPAADDSRSERWVTPVQPAGATLTGEGGMTLWSRTRTGVEARVVLCVQLTVSPGPVGDLLTLPPTVLGTVTYELAAWPAVMTPVSFSFSIPGSDLVVAAGRRIGIRVWVAASSASDVVIAYDHPSLQSALQLNVR